MEQDTVKDKEKLKAMLDHFSQATKLSLVAVNTYGEPFLESTNYLENAFCSYVRRTAAGKNCIHSYCKACKQTLQWKEPYYFLCHAGLVMWALPLFGKDGYHVGAVMCGQVLFWKPDKLFFSALSRRFSPEEIEELKKRADSIQVISPAESESTANLLSIAVDYLRNSANDSLQEQKVLSEWRNVLFERFEARKARFQDAEFDLSVYVKRERRYLQYVRMGNREKIQEMLPVLFTDIEILSDHQEERIRAWFLDFATLSSRAIIEAGADCQMVFRMMERYKKEIKNQKRSEEMAAFTYHTLGRLFEYIYLTCDDDYISVLRKARKYIAHHYQEPLRVADVAREVCLSPSYLCTLFKRKLGNTVHDYILRVRIEKTIELMEDRSLSLKDILRACGFESQSYYTKVFKEMIGVTPGQYRNKFL